MPVTSECRTGERHTCTALVPHTCTALSCRVQPYLIKAAPAAPLARRQRRPLASEAPAAARRAAQGTLDQHVDSSSSRMNTPGHPCRSVVAR